LHLFSPSPRLNPQQFTSFLDVIGLCLKAEDDNWEFERVDGRMPNHVRTANIDNWRLPNPPTAAQAILRPQPGAVVGGYGVPILLVSTKAAGFGLTLVEGTKVFNMEPAWNYATEEQAFNRCHRLGQTKQVFIWRWNMKADFSPEVTRTIETPILELQDGKSCLGKGTLKKPTPEELSMSRIGKVKLLFDLNKKEASPAKVKNERKSIGGGAAAGAGAAAAAGPNF
jgi:SWI/SNF-related matrix-associated actin-dependent regulator of chromatin subfamily A3